MQVLLSDDFWKDEQSPLPGADPNQSDRWGVSPKKILNVTWLGKEQVDGRP